MPHHFEGMGLLKALRKTAVGVWDFNVTADVLVWNEVMFDLFFTNIGDFTTMGQEWKGVVMTYETFIRSVHPDDSERVNAAVFEGAETGKYNITYRSWDRSDPVTGQVKYIQAQASTHHNSDGSTSMIGTCIDISEVILAKDEALKLAVVEAKLKEERLNQEKVFNFVRTLSHETRNPLQGALGNAHHLQEVLKSWRQRIGLSRTATCLEDVLLLDECETLVNEIAACGMHQQYVLNDLLDFEQFSALGSGDANLKVCRVAHIVRLILLQIGKDAKSQGLTIEKKIDLSEKYYVTDEILFRRIITNMVMHAIRVSAARKATVVKIRIEYSRMDEMLQVEVEDAGDPIVTSLRNALTGSIALATVAGLMKTLKGELEHYAVEPVGNVFKAKIPSETMAMDSSTTSSRSSFISQSPTSSRHNVLSVAGHNKAAGFDSKLFRLLVAEDSLCNQKLLRRMLEGKFADVCMCDNGQEAVNSFKSARTQGPGFDVVLLDIHMPVLNGVDAAQIVRCIDSTVPIVFLTGELCDPFTQSISLLQPCDVLTKPSSKEQIMNAIRKCSGRGHTSPARGLNLIERGSSLERDVEEIEVGKGATETENRDTEA
ncbi:unnamed protein product [Chrysoparadoxa australica]